jgi:Holliday junction resolvasome RuvABC endonuclease subunit
LILAIDSGIANCGWSILQPKPARVVDLGVWLSSPNSEVEKSTDRARRIDNLSDLLVDLVKHYGCDSIAAEQMLFHGKLNAVVSQLLPWGSLLGIAAALNLTVYEVPAKQWQPAVLGRKAPYEQLERELGHFIRGQAEAKLLGIPRAKRTHAIDSVGVGLFATFKPATCVRRRKEG